MYDRGVEQARLGFLEAASESVDVQVTEWQIEDWQCWKFPLCFAILA